MPTPHNEAEKSSIAKVVLMPGDPLRAKYIAETYFEPGFRLVNRVRNMFMYTGKYKGVPITVAGSGMGCPSIGIYSYELFADYDVDCIIRIGSAGAYTDKLNLFDVVNVTDCYAETTYPLYAAGIKAEYIKASSEVVSQLDQAAATIKAKLTKPINIFKARAHCTDVFYRLHSDDYKKLYADRNCWAVEQETAALFSNAQRLNKHAGCLLTISDSLVSKQTTTAEQRQTAFDTMMEIALEFAVKYHH